MDGKNVAGMIAVTMYQSESYHEICWSQNVEDNEVACLHILAVAPAYQGKGVSQKMMAEIMAMASENGKKAIRLDVLSSNIPARRMYERLGFVYRGKQKLFAENTGWTDFLFYELPVT